jgi:predicted dehydrogenase
MDMSLNEAVTRRDFVKAVGTTVGGALLSDAAQGGTGVMREPRRYALVGTGDRGSSMWGRAVAERYGDLIHFVGLCDINPLRAAQARARIGVSCPAFSDFDEMCDKAKPSLVMVTTADAFHSEYIVKALDRGIDVMTEKPMVVDESQCRAVLDAERRTGRNIVVTFNYRFSPKHKKIKELLMSGVIGRVLSVDFHWYLDTTHGADYFRRWHRLRERSGSLWVHKATHHFDLVNWWLDADPVDVVARGDLRFYGKNGPFRHTHCRPCPRKADCNFSWDITKDPRMLDIYVNAEQADGYLRDGCVFREDVNIYDTMSALVSYSNGATMSYSLNTFMPIEGYRLAFNGTEGRLEIRDWERQPWIEPEETSIDLIPNFGKHEHVRLPKSDSGHGGGDSRLLDLIFRRPSGVPPHLTLPGSRAGAMSCLTGIAARKSVEERRSIRIADLVAI